MKIQKFIRYTGIILLLVFGWVAGEKLFGLAQANPISLTPVASDEVSKASSYLTLPKLDPFWDELFINGGNLEIVLPTDVVKRNWGQEYKALNAIDRRL